MLFTFNSLYWDFCSVSSISGLLTLVKTAPFNSLYWDFCSVSAKFSEPRNAFGFTFNSLYWDFCSVSATRYASICRCPLTLGFQFPLLGFLFCIIGKNPQLALCILAKCFQFPLLGFLFCICDHCRTVYPLTKKPFNSLYWDFCSVSTYITVTPYKKGLSFQFPLLGFLFCI